MNDLEFEALLKSSKICSQLLLKNSGHYYEASKDFWEIPRTTVWSTPENFWAFWEISQIFWNVPKTTNTFRELPKSPHNLRNFENFWGILNPSWEASRTAENFWELSSLNLKEFFGTSGKIQELQTITRDLGNSEEFGNGSNISRRFRTCSRFQNFLGSFEHFCKVFLKKFQERLESLKNPWKAARTVDKHHIPIFGKFPALKDNGANF